MKRLQDLALSPNQHVALSEVRRRVSAAFDVEAIVLYGSAARGEADEESDVELLILTRLPLTRPTRHQITDLICDINLEYGTNFSSLVVDRNTWERSAISVLPIHDEILRDGIPV